MDDQRRPSIFTTCLKRRRFQRDQRRHDFRETGWGKPAGRVFLQQDAPGLEFDQVQG